MQLEKITKMARDIRKDIVEMTYHAGASGAHIGGALSSADVLAVLYGSVMKVAPDRATDPNRDRFILSKGHSSVGLYAALHRAGFLTEEELNTFEKNGSFLPAHSVMKIEKGIELSSGSLGIGLSFGIGEALHAKRKGLDYKVYVLLGNGECNEGCVWEAVTLAVQLKLDNLYLIIDDNKQQLDGESERILRITSLPDVLSQFGFETYRVNGHHIHELLEKFEQAGKKEAPIAIVMETVKGKGVSFMEQNPVWHHNRISQEEYEKAKKEIEAND